MGIQKDMPQRVNSPQNVSLPKNENSLTFVFFQTRMTFFSML